MMDRPTTAPPSLPTSAGATIASGSSATTSTAVLLPLFGPESLRHAGSFCCLRPPTISSCRDCWRGRKRHSRDHPDAAFFCSEVAVVDRARQVVGYRPVVPPRFTSGYVSPTAMRREIQRTDNWFFGPSVVYRRRLLAEIGYFDESLGTLCDGLAQRLLAFHHGFYFAAEILAVWMVDPQSLSAQTSMSVTESRRVIDAGTRWIAAHFPADVRDNYRTVFGRRLRFNMARQRLLGEKRAKRRGRRLRPAGLGTTRANSHPFPPPGPASRQCVGSRSDHLAHAADEHPRARDLVVVEAGVAAWPTGRGRAPSRRRRRSWLGIAERNRCRAYPRSTFRKAAPRHRVMPLPSLTSSPAFKRLEIWGRLGWRENKRRYRRTVFGPFWTTVSLAMFVIALGLVWSNLWHNRPEGLSAVLDVRDAVLGRYLSTICAEGCGGIVGREAAH